MGLWGWFAAVGRLLDLFSGHFGETMPNRRLHASVPPSLHCKEDVTWLLLESETHIILKAKFRLDFTRDLTFAAL